MTKRHIFAILKPERVYVMESDSLYQFFVKLSDNEKLYQQGKRNTYFENAPLIELNGRMIPFMPYGNADDRRLDNTGNLNLFIKKQSRFSPVPAHVHDWVEISYQYNGICRMYINEERITLTKGQVVLIDRFTPHATDVLGEEDITISIVMPKEYLNERFFGHLSTENIITEFLISSLDSDQKNQNYIYFQSDNDKRVSKYFDSFLCEFYSDFTNKDDVISSLLILIFSSLIDVYQKQKTNSEIEMSRTSIIPILHYISTNFRDCTLESTASYFGLNPKYLTTLLKKKMNISYKELVQRQKLTVAAQMLINTKNSVTEIANRVGYENISFFYRKFKHRYGLLPKEYRDSYSKQP